MFATIFQSQSPWGIRQTTVIPNGDEPLIYTRTLGNHIKLRGSAGRWVLVDRVGRGELFVEAEHEPVLGAPISVPMTHNDERDINLTVADPVNFKPTTLNQKLARAVLGSSVVPSDREFGEMFAEICRTADHKPEHLARYGRTATTIAQTPSVVMEREVPAQPAVVESKPVVVSTPAGGDEQVDRFPAELTVPTFDSTYIERSWNGLSESQMYDIGIANGDNFLLSGDAGVGKTTSASNLAARLGVPFVRLELHQTLDNTITEGRLLPRIGGGWAWHYSQLATAVQQPSVVLLNELSRSSLRNTTLFLGILNERKLSIQTLNEVIDVHPQCIIIADQNVGSQYAGTQAQDSALLDRFNVKLEFEDDPAIEAQIIPSPSLLELAQSLRYLHQTERSKHKTRVGLRMLKNFVKQARTYNFGFAVESFIRNFSVAERESVRFHIDSRYINIAQELNVPVGDYVQN